MSLFRSIRVSSSAFAFLIGIITSLSLSFSPGPNRDTREKPIPITTFVKVRTSAVVEIAGCDEKIEDFDCTPRTYEEEMGMGSGVIIGKGLILTAGHVCDSMLRSSDELGEFVEAEFNRAGKPNGTMKIEHQAVDYYGKVHTIIPLKFSEAPDVCLVGSLTVDSTPAKISNNMPELGERVYNVAAPRGIFFKGVALVFDGFYSGTDWEDDAYYTTPTQPGSSGSPIFNRQGELVGLVYATHTELESVAYTVSLDAIRDFLLEAVAEFEQAQIDLQESDLELQSQLP